MTSACAADPFSRAMADREALIRLCLYALDRARSTGVAERLTEGLAQVGVQVLQPEGERFDPSRHEAGGTVPATDGELDGLVAETEVPGFTDGRQVLRPPVVTVYRAARGTPGGGPAGERGRP
ncbi:nucleotide exchange factor GrpE [Saccharopolyspora sp. HNM0983]|uniref:Nucleotide exchange factor GrpE n=1 Tax=Saccharopolyspora montiporae TaxID=2781240 RepID=A0A929FZK6_9PSEU|nr:nucleotide exchange factor GrpE [Saccharopolyspora sp. HNM0983]MBE9374675.1 nucleotide exchange factor GrpE [Saccharopolyspora sp. HNM0983]